MRSVVCGCGTRAVPARKEQFMKYEIKGGTFPVVVCYLDKGEQMITEKGSMVWQTPNFKMETSGGGLR